MTPTMKELLRLYRALPEGHGLRLGQWFYGRHITGQWIELYYEADDGRAIKKIERWLADHQYTDNMPPVVRDLSLLWSKTA